MREEKELKTLNISALIFVIIGLIIILYLSVKLTPAFVNGVSEGLENLTLTATSPELTSGKPLKTQVFKLQNDINDLKFRAMEIRAYLIDFSKLLALKDLAIAFLFLGVLLAFYAKIRELELKVKGSLKEPPEGSGDKGETSQDKQDKG